MATTKKPSKRSSVKLSCKWCNRSYKSESTLQVHMCVKKRRWVDRDLTHIRLAFRTYQQFYMHNTAAKDPKTMEDFINSSYYEGFVKFGRSCLVNEYLYPEQYATWLITSGTRLDDWAKDRTYDKYLLEFVKKEPGVKALERSIVYLATWEEESGNPWQTYFTNASPSRAVYDIRSAKISPWVIYLSETGDQLLTRLNDEQVKMVDHIIDAEFWLPLFKRNSNEVDEVMHLCNVAGI